VGNGGINAAQAPYKPEDKPVVILLRIAVDDFLRPVHKPL
jgi:hypothetical protein